VTGPARTMYAMRATGPDPARLTGERIPVPEPGTGEVLVEVHATAVTAAELTWPDTWPVIPCHDMSGVVVASGGGVTDWPPGAEVYGLVGFDRLGAAEVIDYSDRFEDQVGDVDVVIDPVGGDVLARSWPVLRQGGILVAIADEPDVAQGGRGDVRATYFVVRPDGSQLRELAALVDHHQLRPAVALTFELGDLPAAFRAQQQRPRPPGKVVVRVDRTAHAQ